MDGRCRANAQAIIENKFATIDPTYVLIWKSIDVGSPEVPTMYDKVQLEVPADVDVFMVRAAFTAQSGNGPRYDGRDYVSYYRVYDDHRGHWQAERSAEHGSYESDPYFIN